MVEEEVSDEIEPGDVRVIFLESEPMAGSPTRGKQRYTIYDGSAGLVEEGYVRVADMVNRQPWLDESFEFPVQITGGPGRAGEAGDAPAPVAVEPV